MKKTLSIPKKLLKRLAHYHYYLKQLQKKQRDFVSVARLAADLVLTDDDVREDISNLNETLGIGDVHNVGLLIELIERYLGYDQENSAVLVGVGNLGSALLDYSGFKEYGLEIQAVFDSNPAIIGTVVAGRVVLPIHSLSEMIERMNIKMGIITTPPEPAQAIANKMIEAGILGIWNFTLEILKAPSHVALQSSTIHCDFLKLSHQIQQNKEQATD